MSALPSKADIAECDSDVRFVPIGDIGLTAGAPADAPQNFEFSIAGEGLRRLDLRTTAHSS
jgi:hypothetical protein